jgi:hypothetical protein
LSPYTLIAIFSIFILVFLCLFLVLFLRPEQSTQGRESQIRGTIAGLSAANAQQFDMLFGDGDYRVLRGRPELKAVSAKLRHDRRRVALLWLGELQRDVLVVWEFRRFLVRHGLPVTFREEAAIGCGACFALAYLNVLQMTVFLCGPFVFSSAVRSAKFPVERLSGQGAHLLSHAPDAVRVQLQRKWTQHVVAWNVG